MNCENGPMDAADASRVQPGCVGAEASVTWTPVKHLYYNQQVIGLSLWQCSSLYSALQWSWAPKSPPVRPPHGCRESDGSAEAFGFRCATPYSGAKVVPQQRLKALTLRWGASVSWSWAPRTLQSPQSRKHTTGIWQSADQKVGGKYLHAVKIQDHKRTRVEILL